MNPYFEQTILNAEPIALTAMVYKKAITSVREAREHLRERRVRERSDAVMRVYAAIVELLTALNGEAAPDLAARLQGLYSYMLERLVEANMKQADGPLEEVLNLLLTLDEAWAGVAAASEQRNETAAENKRPEVVVLDRWNRTGAATEEGIRLALTA